MRRTGAVLLLAVLVAAGCTGDGGPATPTVTATASPTSSPTPSPTPSPSPSPTSSPSPTPTPTASSPAPGDSPTPTPSSSPTTGGTPGEVTPEAALAAAAERRRERPECADAGPIADDFHRVVTEHDGALLVFVTCFVGAYQASGELLAYDGQLRAWPVEQWRDGRVVEDVEVVGDVVVAPDGLVENLQLYRGLGDCGLLQRWEIDGQRLVLVEAREQPCDGDAPGPVTQWPRVHP